MSFLVCKSFIFEYLGHKFDVGKYFYSLRSCFTSFTNFYCYGWWFLLIKNGLKKREVVNWWVFFMISTDFRQRIVCPQLFLSWIIYISSFLLNYHVFQNSKYWIYHEFLSLVHFSWKIILFLSNSNLDHFFVSNGPFEIYETIIMHLFIIRLILEFNMR